MNISTIWAGYNLLRVLTQRKAGVTPPASKGPWRPPQWNNLPTKKEQLILVKTNINGYFFDAIIREEHTSTLQITEHPVQSGANITDHAFMQPARLVMEIGMSDAMDAMYPGQFDDTAYTKSVSAYRVLLDLQKSRLPLSVLTRLYLYKNMLIESLSAPDDYKTLYGLRCTVTMREIMVVDVAQGTVSARPQTTGSTQQGTVQPTEAPPSILGANDPNGTTTRNQGG